MNTMKLPGVCVQQKLFENLSQCVLATCCVRWERDVSFVGGRQLIDLSWQTSCLNTSMLRHMNATLINRFTLAQWRDVEAVMSSQVLQLHSGNQHWLTGFGTVVLDPVGSAETQKVVFTEAVQSLHTACDILTRTGKHISPASGGLTLKSSPGCESLTQHAVKMSTGADSQWSLGPNEL